MKCEPYFNSRLTFFCEFETVKAGVCEVYFCTYTSRCLYMLFGYVSCNKGCMSRNLQAASLLDQPYSHPSCLQDSILTFARSIRASEIGGVSRCVIGFRVKGNFPQRERTPRPRPFLPPTAQAPCIHPVQWPRERRLALLPLGLCVSTRLIRLDARTLTQDGPFL
jgi:hypothetical protein